MSKRLKLHAILVEVLGSRYVYYQPPETIKMEYPCIVYSKLNNDPKYANNNAYFNKQRYSLIVIDKDPDSEIGDNILNIPFTAHDRSYTTNNLNHNVYTIYI